MKVDFKNFLVNWEKFGGTDQAYFQKKNQFFS